MGWKIVYGLGVLAVVLLVLDSVGLIAYHSLHGLAQSRSTVGTAVVLVIVAAIAYTIGKSRGSR